MQINSDFDKPSLLICKFLVFIEQIYFIGVHLWLIMRKDDETILGTD